MTVFRCSNNIGVGVATCKVCFGSINVFMPGTNITFERSIYNLPDVLVWMAYIYLCSLILFALAEGFPVDRGMYLVAFSFFLQIAIFYPCYVLLTSRSQKTNMADRAMVEPDQKVFIPLSAEDIYIVVFGRIVQGSLILCTELTGSYVFVCFRFNVACSVVCFDFFSLACFCCVFNELKNVARPTKG